MKSSTTQILDCFVGQDSYLKRALQIYEIRLLRSSQAYIQLYLKCKEMGTVSCSVNEKCFSMCHERKIVCLVVIAFLLIDHEFIKTYLYLATNCGSKKALLLIAYILLLPRE